MGMHVTYQNTLYSEQIEPKVGEIFLSTFRF